MRVRIVSILVVLLVGAGGLAAWLLHRGGVPGETRLTLRCSVEPAGEIPFLLQEAHSAKFKYLVGHAAGLKPVYAQKLAVEAVPNSPWLVARVAAPDADTARRYAEVLVQSLQAQCAGRARLAVLEQTLR